MTTRVCLLVDQTGVREYFISALEQMLSDLDARITLVVINEDPSLPPNSLPAAFFEGLSSTVSYFRNIITETPPYLQRRELEKISILSEPDFRYVKPLQTDDGAGEEIPEDTVSEIEDRADIVLRHGFGILQGRILSGPAHNVLSYHHGDIRRYRGVALGFWNFLENERTAGVTLQRLTPRLDGGEIVAYREIDIDDCYTWQEVRARLYRVSIPMLTEGVRNVTNPEFNPVKPGSLGELYTTSDVYRLGTLTKYVLKNNIGRAQRLFCRR